MNAAEDTIYRALKTKDAVEPSMAFIKKEQKQRLYVLDKLLALKPVSKRWGSNDYYYITILKFLLIPRETIYEMYKAAPQRQKAQAHKEKAPILQKFDYSCLGINSEEWELFVQACYKVIADPSKWK